MKNALFRYCVDLYGDEKFNIKPATRTHKSYFNNLDELPKILETYPEMLFAEVFEYNKVSDCYEPIKQMVIGYSYFFQSDKFDKKFVAINDGTAIKTVIEDVIKKQVNQWTLYNMSLKCVVAGGHNE